MEGKFKEILKFKPYWDMNRKEKREYKRWLLKNNMWDGAEISERQEIESAKRFNHQSNKLKGL